MAVNSGAIAPEAFTDPLADVRWTDNLAAVFGTGSDAKIYYDGTNWLFQPAVAGTGMAQFQRSSIGATPTDVIGVYNLTDAAAGAQQYSGAIRLHGEGWTTDGAGASQNVDMRAYLVPVQGAANPTAYLAIDFGINDAAFGNRLQLNSAGQLLLGASQVNRIGPDSGGNMELIGVGRDVYLGRDSVLVTVTTGALRLASGVALQVNSIQVVGAQQTGIADADGTLADITTKFNSLLGTLETHGLIAVA